MEYWEVQGYGTFFSMEEAEQYAREHNLPDYLVNKVPYFGQADNFTECHVFNAGASRRPDFKRKSRKLNEN